MFKLLVKETPITKKLVVELKEKYEGIEVILGEINIDTIKDVNGVMCWTLSEEEVNCAKNLEVVFAPLTGLNGYPEQLLQKRNIPIINTHAKAKYIAERGFSLLLTTMGKINKTDRIFKTTYQWANRGYDELWHSLYNKKIAFYGFGHIGKSFYDLVQPFNPTINTLERYKGRCKAHNYYENLLELCKNSDILFISTSLNDETRNSVTLEHLKSLGGFVVNVARGAIINEEDFYIALKENYLLGAASDVWYNYPTDNSPLKPSSFPFWELDNIVMSPHTAWSTHEDKFVQLEDTFSNIEIYLKNSLNIL